KSPGARPRGRRSAREERLRDRAGARRLGRRPRQAGARAGEIRNAAARQSVRLQRAMNAFLVALMLGANSSAPAAPAPPIPPPPAQAPATTSVPREPPPKPVPTDAQCAALPSLKSPFAFSPDRKSVV